MVEEKIKLKTKIPIVSPEEFSEALIAIINQEKIQNVQYYFT